MDIITKEYVRKTIQKLKRPADSYKNDYGRVLIMAGSPGMAGAAVLCGTSALKTGSGLVKYCVPDVVRDVLQVAVPEATCLPRNPAAVRGSFEAAAAGPGLGDVDADKEILKALFSEFKGTLVLDADGLNDIVRFGIAEELKAARPSVIITPHEGEAARMLRVSELISREKTALELCEKFNVITVLKGHETLIADQKGRMSINKETGNPGMATGGSGDVLTGIIASLAGQGLTPWQAAETGVYLHGYAGDICAEEIGQAGMLAGDICRAIPKAMKDNL